MEKEIEYQLIMNKIELLLSKATQNGGFDRLTKTEKELLQQYSLLAENYEDSIPIMPIKQPLTLVSMIKFKMYENNFSQKQLANTLEITESRLSEILKGKRRVTIDLAKQLYHKLDIDAEFILKTA